MVVRFSARVGGFGGAFTEDNGFCWLFESAMTRQVSRFPRKRESRVSGPLAARAVCAIVLVVAAFPAGAADFYAGKTINFVVGTDAGGGFSIYARTSASISRAIFRASRRWS